jgi:carboxymethylenebutenolidase
MKKIGTLILLMSLSLVACQNTETESDSDQAFKEAHDIPKEIEFNAEGEMITFATADEQEGAAYKLQSKETEVDKDLFVIHEWWGLNDFVKRESDRLYESLNGEVTVMALDLYDGNVATTRDDAKKFMAGVSEERAKMIIQGAIAEAGEFAEIATIGWCFGGGWSLKTSIMAGEQGAGCVIYYGMPVTEAKDLAPIQSDILGIFAENDQWITPEVANAFEDLAKATGKNIENHIFKANHAFANPSGESYNNEAATEANKIALDFLKARLL